MSEQKFEIYICEEGTEIFDTFLTLLPDKNSEEDQIDSGHIQRAGITSPVSCFYSEKIKILSFTTSLDLNHYLLKCHSSLSSLFIIDIDPDIGSLYNIRDLTCPMELIVLMRSKEYDFIQHLIHSGIDGFIFKPNHLPTLVEKFKAKMTKQYPNIHLSFSIDHHGKTTSHKYALKYLLGTVLDRRKSSTFSEYYQLHILAEIQKFNMFSKKRTVLIVDDDVDLSEDLCKRLNRLFNVEVSNSGEEALAVLKEDSQVDVILLDVRMPGIKGDDLIFKIKEINTYVKIIIHTAFKDIDVLIKVYKSPVYRYLNKSEDIHYEVEICDAIDCKDIQTGAYLHSSNAIDIMFNLHMDYLALFGEKPTFRDFMVYYPHTEDYLKSAQKDQALPSLCYELGAANFAKKIQQEFIKNPMEFKLENII